MCFLLGSCGDITQVDNLSTSVDFGPEVADLMGRKLAAEAERTIRRMKWDAKGVVDAHTVTVPVAIRDEPDPSREVPPFGLGSDGPERRYGKIFDAEKQKGAEERRKTPILQAEIQAIRVGPLGVVGNGSEYFCECQLRIKKASRMAFTWVSSLSNEYIGYVRTAQAFVGGGYEPRTARSSKLAPDGGQKLVEGAVRALQRVVAKP